VEERGGGESLTGHGFEEEEPVGEEADSLCLRGRPARGEERRAGSCVVDGYLDQIENLNVRQLLPGSYFGSCLSCSSDYGQNREEECKMFEAKTLTDANVPFLVNILFYFSSSNLI
jgi:hypothetical protein